MNARHRYDFSNLLRARYIHLSTIIIILQSLALAYENMAVSKEGVLSEVNLEVSRSISVAPLHAEIQRW